MMLVVPNLVMLAGAIVSALCGLSADFAVAMMQTQMVAEPDRANTAAVQPYDNPQLAVEKPELPIKPWTKGRWLKRSETGTELIELANGEKFWFQAGDFFPLYRVKADKPVEIMSYRASHNDEGKLKWEINSLNPKMYLKPAEIVALDPTPLQLMGLYRFYTEDGRSGVVGVWDLAVIGDAGGIRE